MERILVWAQATVVNGNQKDLLLGRIFGIVFLMWVMAVYCFEIESLTVSTQQMHDIVQGALNQLTESI